MRKVVIVSLLLAFLPMPAVALGYLQISVTSGLLGTDGNEILSVLTCMDTHSVDGVWTAPAEYRKMSLIAGRYQSNWYNVMGPDSRNGFEAYIFSGLDVDSSSITVMFSSSWDQPWNIAIFDHNGATVCRYTLPPYGRWGMQLTPNPAGLNQKSTQGYNLSMIETTPEPGTFACMLTGLAGFGILRRRR